ncbi:MAG: hypothetical protein A3G33_06125 [Omnitrophica bacterium RIFCSPLOWO2_12_FULL_44_17]|uniref:Uncharacterized protein n=1 Tax=Candidatus Danuiimicrobium aquiferis TaxID=1801832 RepID=A0A1G1KR03_9BACT|nr:MAG: hypothetical protein A3G33_06125 [Omnitrophica bacterium RIFCSPLOWO2_12_FULL_44_17]OGX04063.1 MAG: hypothetical protein A3J12_08690 [Omnitrophica bacterium RIFCSPLOWO2_02_FULL_44_11]
MAIVNKLMCEVKSGKNLYQGENMASDKKTVRELKELLKKINNFEKDLWRLKNTLSRHIGQQKRQPSGQ